jgi:glycosyltransferase involved in cell wall biosynthesis
VSRAELTAIVATRDRPDKLAACLQALHRQRTDISLDILVVDDRSRDPAAVAHAVATAPGARLLAVSTPGISSARNTGVLAARTDYLAFTDDDCLVQPGWGRALLERLRAGNPLVAGRTLSGRTQGVLAAASQLAANAPLSSRLPTAPASNLACQRELAVEIPFDETFLDVGGEERDWTARLAAHGYELVWEPRAEVLHLPSLTLKDFWRKHVSYGRGAYRYRRRYAGGRLEPPRFYADLVVLGFQEGLPIGLALCLAQVATAVGFVAEARTRR